MRSRYSVFGPPPNKNTLTLWDRMVQQNRCSAKTTGNSNGASETSAYPNPVSSSKGNSTRANSPNKLGGLESNRAILARNLCSSVRSSRKATKTISQMERSDQLPRSRLASTPDA